MTVVSAFGKINLTLEVLGVRPDGYHALRSVVLPIDLADMLTFEPAAEFSTDTGFADDLILKAAAALARESGRAADSLPAYAVHVTKRIPAGGGLGGGSADAAATLRALNDLWRMGLSPAELARVGAAVGSDVPSLVLGAAVGPVLMEGRGERVSPLCLAKPLHLVLANPGVFSSTRAVYASCCARPQGDDAAFARVCAALADGDWARIAACAANDLEDAAIRLHPAIGRLKDALCAQGLAGVTMSGSGSTVFGFAPDEVTAQAVAARISSGAEQGVRAWAVTCPASRGDDEFQNEKKKGKQP